MAVSAKRKVAQKKAAKKRPQTWKPGQSGNPKGAPKRGQSWKEIINEIGDMTPDEARQVCRTLFDRIRIHDEITLKTAVVMRVYAALLFEPQPGLLSAFMDRVEGKVTQPLEITWRERVKELGLDPDQVIREVEEWLADRRAEKVTG